MSSLVDAVSCCIDEIDKWMSSNRLKLNADKTQFIWLGSSFNLGKVDIQLVNLGAGTVLVQSNVNDLGVLLLLLLDSWCRAIMSTIISN